MRYKNTLKCQVKINAKSNQTKKIAKNRSLVETFKKKKKMQ